MPPTDADTLNGLARLARLELSAEELQRFAPELGRILEAFGALERHIPRPGEPAELPPLALREDEPVPFPGRAELLASASESEDGFFVVPKTVGGEA